MNPQSLYFQFRNSPSIRQRATEELNLRLQQDPLYLRHYIQQLNLLARNLSWPAASLWVHFTREKDIYQGSRILLEDEAFLALLPRDPAGPKIMVWMVQPQRACEAYDILALYGAVYGRPELSWSSLLYQDFSERISRTSWDGLRLSPLTYASLRG